MLNEIVEDAQAGMEKSLSALDVAFKKRFLAFTGAPGENGPEGQPPMQGGKPYGGFYAGKGSRKFTTINVDMLYAKLIHEFEPNMIIIFFI